MKRLFFLIAIWVGGAIAVREILSPERRERISHLPESTRARMMERMCSMMEEMPDDSPPKLVTSILPRLQEQNDQILALLREQNDLLRERGSAAES